MSIHASAHAGGRPDLLAIIPLALVPREVRFLTCLVDAGFPSPAADDLEEPVDLAAWLVRHPAASYVMRVQGWSMAGANISDGDHVVVDRSMDFRSSRDGNRRSWCQLRATSTYRAWSAAILDEPRIAGGVADVVGASSPDDPVTDPEPCSNDAVVNPEAPTSPFREFDLRERNGVSGDHRADAARASLRAALPVPTDTFVTGDLPLLLTRMSGLAAVASSRRARDDD